MSTSPDLSVGSILRLLAHRLGVLGRPTAPGAHAQEREPERGVMAPVQIAKQPVVPILLELPASALSGGRRDELIRELDAVLDHFELSQGLSLPRISVGVANPATDAEIVDDWRLMVFEVPIARGAMPDENPAQSLGSAVREALRRHLSRFVGIEEASDMLQRFAISCPETVKEVLRQISMLRFSEILRRLVEEEVPLRHVRDVLEVLAEYGQREKDVHTLSEYARIALKDHICYRYAPQGMLSAAVLTPSLEETLRQALRVNGGKQQLAVDPAFARQIIARVRDSVERHGGQIILTAVDLRRHVRKLIEHECFDVPVLSYHEMVPTLLIDVRDRIDLPVAPAEAA